MSCSSAALCCQIQILRDVDAVNCDWIFVSVSFLQCKTFFLPVVIAMAFYSMWTCFFFMSCSFVLFFFLCAFSHLSSLKAKLYFLLPLPSKMQSSFLISSTTHFPFSSLQLGSCLRPASQSNFSSTAASLHEAVVQTSVFTTADEQHGF